MAARDAAFGDSELIVSSVKLRELSPGLRTGCENQLLRGAQCGCVPRYHWSLSGGSSRAAVAFRGMRLGAACYANAAMADPEGRRATYDDLRAVPAHLVAEILNGELRTSPRPSPPHARAASSLGGELYGPFDRGLPRLSRCAGVQRGLHTVMSLAFEGDSSFEQSC